MKLAIMQPYFFPYLGYFQLIDAVDKFVVHDDVQFIKGGWINKNRILINNGSFNIGIPIRKDSSKKKINERFFIDKSDIFKIKLLRQIENAYKKAPFFEEIFPFVTNLLSFEENNVSKFNIYVLNELCGLLNISTQFYNSSEIAKQNYLTGEDRVININHIMGSTVYINPIGGAKLYRRDTFLNSKVELRFLITINYSYMQFGESFVPDLSIIDLLMFNSIESRNKLLKKYILE